MSVKTNMSNSTKTNLAALGLIIVAVGRCMTIFFTEGFEGFSPAVMAELGGYFTAAWSLFSVVDSKTPEIDQVESGQRRT